MSTQAPKLIVVVPCYNEEATLPVSSPLFADELAARYVAGAGEPLQLNLAPSTLAGAATSVVFTGLPDGLAYDAATGCVTGTPERVGIFKVTVTVVSAKGQKLTRTFNVTIGVPDCCIGTFNGFIGIPRQDSPDPLVLDNRGTFRLFAPSNASLSAKVVTAKGTYPFTGHGWIVNDDGSYTADLATADGKDKVLFTVSADSISADFVSYGTFTASYGARYEVWAQRSPFERDESGAYVSLEPVWNPVVAGVCGFCAGGGLQRGSVRGRHGHAGGQDRDTCGERGDVYGDCFRGRRGRWICPG